MIEKSTAMHEDYSQTYYRQWVIFFLLVAGLGTWYWTVPTRVVLLKTSRVQMSSGWTALLSVTCCAQLSAVCVMLPAEVIEKTAVKFAARLLTIVTSAWEGFAGSKTPVPGESQAARVVHAQRALQARPTTGLDLIPIGQDEFRVREMIPEENCSSLDRFQRKPGKLYQAIVEAGALTGRAHSRGSLAVEGGDETVRLLEWAEGAALDSILAAAARYAERTRLAFKAFRGELRASGPHPEPAEDLVSRQGRKEGKR